MNQLSKFLAGTAFCMSSASFLFSCNRADDAVTDTPAPAPAVGTGDLDPSSKPSPLPPTTTPTTPRVVTLDGVTDSTEEDLIDLSSELEELSEEAKKANADAGP